MESLLLVFFLLLANAVAGYEVPGPRGKYNVTLTTGEMIDYARNDPYAPTPTPRAMMVSVFQPATCASTVDVRYMPKTTAKYQGPALEQTFNISINFAPVFLKARLPVCPSYPDGCTPLDDGPILLFSTSYSIPRFYYNVLASSLTSQGFTVITIDHPHDANIIVYPDGHAVYNNATILDSPTWGAYVRAADASFIIDQLSNATAIAELLPNRGPQPFPTDRIAMLGHSLGGATSIIAAKQDDRIRGAVNWDGTIFGSPDLSELSQPVLFMTHDKTVPPDWLKAWKQMDGPKLILKVANTTHQSFSDFPTLVQADGQNPAQYADLLGTIDPAEMVDLLTTYTTAWMNGAFKGHEGGALLEGNKPDKFPAVSVLKKANFGRDARYLARLV